MDGELPEKTINLSRMSLIYQSIWTIEGDSVTSEVTLHISIQQNLACQRGNILRASELR